MSIVMLGKTIAIDTAKPLPQYNNGPAKAYAASDNARTSSKNLLAYICEPAFISRRATLNNYKGLACPGAFMFVTNGICDWPLTGDQRFVIIYDTHSHAPIMTKPEEIVSWRDSEAIEFFIKPMSVALNEFRNRNIFHGNIRPANIFFSVAGKLSPVIVGDCLSVPPSSTQPVLYEPIERAMAHPLGRGEGAPADDIYAFGVTLALLLRTENPMENFTEMQILRHKMEHGSYMSIVGKDRFAGHITEVLRGTLHDNPSQRWSIDDLLSWLDGRRLSPQAGIRKKKGTRPIEFAGAKYYYADDLAFAMQGNRMQSVNLIESGDIIEWIERSVSDPETSELLRNFLGKDLAKSKTRGNSDAMLSGVISALEPSFPVFYKDTSLLPLGVGYYYGALVSQGAEIADLSDLIQLNVFPNYIFMQHDGQTKYAGLLKVYDGCRLSVSQSGVGYGIERCLYALCPDLQCLSSKFKGYYVTNTYNMMDTFESLCERNIQTNALFLDRHSIAYLSLFESNLIDGRLYDLNSRNKHQQILGNLKCLASMQKVTRLSSYPNIARVMADNLEELYERFHDQNLKKKVKADVTKAAKRGNLIEMLDILDNGVVKSRDREDFRRAMREYAAMKEEYAKLEISMRDAANFGRASGHNIAAAISWGLSLIIIMMMLVMHFSKGGL